VLAQLVDVGCATLDFQVQPIEVDLLAEDVLPSRPGFCLNLVNLALLSRQATFDTGTLLLNVANLKLDVLQIPQGLERCSHPRSPPSALM
jgi:hypothetical protein